VVRDRLTYLPAAKLRCIEQALAETGAIDGDILEFGVALGGSGILLARAALPSRRFIGFDVFGTIPPPTSEKDDEKSRRRFATIASGRSGGIGGDLYYGYREDLLGDVVRAFARHGVPVDGECVMLHKGLFEETWPLERVGTIAFAHIDCDWYDPVSYCLSARADRLHPDGIIAIDDYHDYGGCHAAVDEFLASHPDFAFDDGPNPFIRRRRDGAGAQDASSAPTSRASRL